MSVETKKREKETWNRFLSRRETFERESDKPYSFGVLWTYVYRRNFEAILRLIGNMKGRMILDIGCGGGWLGEWFTLEGATAVGLDVSFQFCRVAKKRSARKGTRISYVCADGENLPFKEDAFYASVAYQCLHHLPNPEKAIGEALRVSKVFVLGDEPTSVVLPDFFIRLLKILSLSSLHVGELSGIKEKRFDPLKLRGKLQNSRCLVNYEKQWSFVPTFFSRAEECSIIKAAYKTVYRVLMGIGPVRNLGHGLTMIVERRE